MAQCSTTWPSAIRNQWVWVVANVREFATAHNINATFAFLDGERCGRGRKQMGFFAKPMPESGEPVDYGDDEEGEDGASDEDEEVADPSPEQIDQATRMAETDVLRPPSNRIIARAKVPIPWANL